MKIRRITVGVLLLLTVLFIADIRFSGLGTKDLDRRSPWEFEMTQREGVRKVEKAQDFSRAQDDLTSLSINGRFGTVELESTDSEQIVVRAKVLGSSEEQLQDWEVAEEIRDSEVRYELRSDLGDGRQEVAVTYVVEVPVGMDVSINQQFGTVKVDDFVGYLDINASFSQVMVNGLQGSAHISNDFGEINLERIAGPLRLEDSFSTSKIGLVSLEGGYDFEVNLTSGTLKGNAPLEITREQNRIIGHGTTGEGLHPIVITSSFGTVTLDLK